MRLWIHATLLQRLTWSEPGRQTCIRRCNKHFNPELSDWNGQIDIVSSKFQFLPCCFFFNFPPPIIGITIKHCLCTEYEVAGGKSIYSAHRKSKITEHGCSALPTGQEVKYTPTQVQDPRMKGVFSQRKTCQKLPCISVWTQQLQRRSRGNTYARRLNVTVSKQRAASS